MKKPNYPVFQFKKNPDGVFKPQDLVLGPIFDLRRDHVYIPIQNDKFVEKLMVKDTTPMLENFMMNLKGSRLGERLTAQFKEAGFDQPPEFTVYFDESATAEHCALAANLKQILTRVAKKAKAEKNPKVETASGIRNLKSVPRPNLEGHKILKDVEAVR